MMENKILELCFITCFLPVMISSFGKRIGITQTDSSKHFCGNEANMSFEVIENISSVIASDVSLTVCAEEIDLSTIISIKNLSNIAIQGRNSTINCEGESGFEFIGVTNLSLYSLMFSGCAMKGLEKPASVLFCNSAKISLLQVRIVNSSGVALLIQNSAGIVEIRECSFESNKQHLSVNFQDSSSPSTCSITSCLFNFADKTTEFGGGLDLTIAGSKFISIWVSLAMFVQNNAQNGGGISVRYSNSQNCSIEITSSSFIQNEATEGGGLFVNIDSSLRTTLNMVVKDSCFDANNATLGGGTKIASTGMEDRGVLLTFTNITWNKNSALFGSAVVVGPDSVYAVVGGFFPDLKFSNVTFTNNRVSQLPVDNDQNYVKQYTVGTGGLYCTYFKLNFTDSLDVFDNNGTAFHLESCTMYLAANSRATFANNEGYYGGAVHLRSSQIVAASMVQVNFLNNTAYGSGGGIHYYTSTTLWTRYIKVCFLSKDSKESNGIMFNFTNNYRRRNYKQCIDSIFALSIEPCMNSFGFNNTTYDENTIFSSLGSFCFEPKETGRSHHIHTAVRKSKITTIKTKITKVVPGEQHPIRIESKTDFDTNSTNLFSVSVHATTEGMEVIASPDSVWSNSSITFKGCPGDVADVVLSTLTARKISMKFAIELVDCPPGFFIEEGECTCIKEKSGIETCEGGKGGKVENFTANRTKGMWVCHTINVNDLKHGYCPAGYCSDEHLLKLENDSSQTLNVCQEGRQGELCGACSSSYSVHYHSRYYRCDSTDLCYLGWLFYLLTEIVPVTILFIAIIYSDKSLSSGLTNGLVFYAQILLTLKIDGEKYFKLPPFVSGALGYRSLFYGIFNLDFFVHEKLAFCLWENANSLSMMAMDYLTQAYALALVFVFVMFLKYSHRLYSVAAAMGIRLPNTAKSTIHGITAFLILTYSQNVNVSIALLRPGFVYNQNGSYETVVHYMGVCTYRNPCYIPYALLASTILTLFVVIPTLLLILYPIHYKMLFLLNISESRCIVKFVRPLEKIKPLFDSFQSTFKDNFRFFSGLYLLCRLAIGLTFTINTPANYHLVVEAELVLIFVIHSVCQPYKEALHNVASSLLLGNLILINTLSIFHLYHHELHLQRVLISTKITGAIQVIFLYAPIVVALAFACKEAITSLKKRFGLANKCEVQEDVISSLIELESVSKVDRNSHSFEPSTSYQKLDSTSCSDDYA